jgi:hypothetical protein
MRRVTGTSTTQRPQMRVSMILCGDLFVNSGHLYKNTHRMELDTMANLKFGDLLKINSGIILHQVNYLGTLNAGLGKLLSDKYPGLAESLFKHASINILSMDSHSNLGTHYDYVMEDLTIINCFTEKGLCSERQPNDPPNTQYNSIIECFNSVMKKYSKEADEGKIYLPFKYGCGLAGGNWYIVNEILKDYPFVVVARHEDFYKFLLDGK